jgi:hypothetical protein
MKTNILLVVPSTQSGKPGVSLIPRKIPGHSQAVRQALARMQRSRSQSAGRVWINAN